MDLHLHIASGVLVPFSVTACFGRFSDGNQTTWRFDLRFVRIGANCRRLWCDRNETQNPWKNLLNHCYAMYSTYPVHYHRLTLLSTSGFEGIQ